MDCRKPPVSVYVSKLVESGPRYSFWVVIENSKGQTLTPQVFRAYSYNGSSGLSIEEARDRALIEAHELAGFFGMKAEPFYDNGVLYEPTMVFDRYADDEPSVSDEFVK